MKKNDDDVDSDFNHHDIMAKDIGIFVYIYCMGYVCFGGKDKDISCQSLTINIPQRMRSLGVTKHSEDNWD